MNRLLAILALSVLLAPLHSARADGDWSAARDRTDRFKSEYEELRRLTPEIDSDTNEMRSTYASWRTSCQ